MSKDKVILLDRDGVLNKIVIDSEHGTIDSPLNPDQVDVFDWVPTSLLDLQKAGYSLAIVTNQPAWAKGKTTKKNLEDAHSKVIHLAEASGAKIQSSHICYHRKEDNCLCRKPATKLLEEALKGFDLEHSWIIGDGITDIEAGKRMGLKTVFLGPQKCDARKIFSDRDLSPTIWTDNLLEAVKVIVSEGI